LGLRKFASPGGVLALDHELLAAHGVEVHNVISSEVYISQDIARKIDSQLPPA